MALMSEDKRVFFSGSAIVVNDETAERAEEAAERAEAAASSLSPPDEGEFIATGLTNSFVIPSEYPNSSSIELVVGGAYQAPSSFTTSISSGNTVVTWSGIPGIGVNFPIGVVVSWRASMRGIE